MSIYFDIKSIRELLGEKSFREQKEFTLEELAEYNGSSGKPAYVAVDGIVYDVSRQSAWGGGTHFGLISGKDLTEQFKSCHGIEQILSSLPKVGVLKSEPTEPLSRESICPVVRRKKASGSRIISMAMKGIKNRVIKKPNAIWIEATGCSGNIISLLNAKDPDMVYLLREMINLKYNNSIMAAEGENAFQIFLDTLNTDFILIVDGAVSTRDNGLYTVVANYKGKKITAMEAIKMAGEKAKHILAVGTCASHGGISAARPNPSESISLEKFLGRKVIKLPGCPCHPDWLIGTVAHLLVKGEPELDSEGRPIMFYGITIHDHCTRRSYFDKGIFAKKLGEETCMFKLGCRGPVTKTDCPTRKWNEYVNWPIGANTPCIGCAQAYFPDGMEPFVTY